MRLFIAIRLEDGLKDAVRSLQNELRRRGVEGNFTRPENLHLTLAFIGEYGDPDRVTEAMEQLRAEPIRLSAGGFGSFGELWWLGVEDGGRLDRLARSLRRALAERDIPFDRKRFTPHITLVRKPQYRCDPRLGDLAIPQAEMTARRVSLMLSTRGKNGVIYTELGSVGLGGAPEDEKG